MKLTPALLGGRLARRIFLLFVISALVPIAATAWLSLSQTQRVLTAEAREQLRVLAKGYGMSVFDGLGHARSELWELAQRLQDRVATVEALDANSGVHWLEAAVLWRASGSSTPLKGTIEGMPALAQRFAKDMVSDQPAILWLTERPGAVFMALPLEGKAPGAAILITELNPAFLWNTDRFASATSRLCVVDTGGNPVHCPDGLPPATLKQLHSARASSSTGQLDWSWNDQKYLGAYWDLFLATGFSNITWTVVASQSKADTLRAVMDFQREFPRVLVLSVLLVTFLSLLQIRRTLIPLERLMWGIRRIARGDFQSRVAIHSGDEFQELGVAFDAMAGRLGRQFNAMSALSRVDETLLITRRLDPNLRQILEQAPAVVQCDFASLVVADSGAPPTAVAYALGGASEPIELSPADVEPLRAHLQGILIDNGGADAGYLRGLKALGARFVFAVPVFLGEQFRGLLALGYCERPNHGDEDRTQALALANRVALALSLEDWQQRLYRQAHYDSLTWLPNRRLFKKRIQDEILRAQHAGTKVGLLFMDLDHFKNVNDSLGHAAGDVLLQLAAARLKRCVRGTDAVARLGGDEFAVILTNLHNAEDAKPVAQKVIHEFASSFLVEEREVVVGATIGIAICPNDGDSWQELLKKADMALYKAKSKGRNGYSFFEPEMDVRAWERMVLGADLHKALEHGELFLEYQPQIEIGTNLVVGAEALVRWRHPDRGLVSPGQFIPLAEEIGLITPIGEWVLVEACRQFLDWAAAGVAPRSIAVNVSSSQFEREDFLEWLRATLAGIGMPPECLELEITESVLVEDMRGMATLARDLKGLGVRLAMDDFGTRYSSLSYLKSFDVNVLKLDRSFILDVATDAAAAGIVRAVTEVAHLLDLDVLAEGVETQEQLAKLGELECDQVQGFYFSRPIAPAAFAEYSCEHGLAAKDSVAPLPEAKVGYG